VQDLLPVRAQSGDGRVLPRLEVSSGVSYDDPTWAVESGAGGPALRQLADAGRYEYGRRVEQVIAAPGGITRVSIGVIVPRELDAASLERIRELVRVVAGIDDARGDEVIVRTLADVGGRREAPGRGRAASAVMSRSTRAPPSRQSGRPPAAGATEPRRAVFAAPAGSGAPLRTRHLVARRRLSGRGGHGRRARRAAARAQR
jgi:flagellar M-ring protein FliF